MTQNEFNNYRKEMVALVRQISLSSMIMENAIINHHAHELPKQYHRCIQTIKNLANLSALLMKVKKGMDNWIAIRRIFGLENEYPANKVLVEAKLDNLNETRIYLVDRQEHKTAAFYMIKDTDILQENLVMFNGHAQGEVITEKLPKEATAQNPICPNRSLSGLL